MLAFVFAFCHVCRSIDYPIFTPMLVEATAYGIKAHINNGNGGHDINSLEPRAW
ncbi:MAG: hypothetical protein IPL73_21860 [Candidatus Obscuribacter sp.]|nr:hypothetical protein [Candidatus Obscuribacter sp.]